MPDLRDKSQQHRFLSKIRKKLLHKADKLYLLADFVDQETAIKLGRIEANLIDLSYDLQDLIDENLAELEHSGDFS